MIINNNNNNVINTNLYLLPPSPSPSALPISYFFPDSPSPPSNTLCEIYLIIKIGLIHQTDFSLLICLNLCLLKKIFFFFISFNSIKDVELAK
jgi:hypothetical protein